MYTQTKVVHSEKSNFDKWANNTNQTVQQCVEKYNTQQNIIPIQQNRNTIIFKAIE